MPKSIILSLSTDELKEVVANSFSITDALRNMGYTNPRTKHTRDCFKKRIEEEGIDTVHFDTHRKNGVSNNVKRSLSDILIENSTYSNRSSLVKRMIEECVMEYKCVGCGNEGQWNGKPLSLQLDHVNGISNDHRIENLRLLCPNCHSQTETFAGRNNKTT